MYTSTIYACQVYGIYGTYTQYLYYHNYNRLTQYNYVNEMKLCMEICLHNIVILIQHNNYISII